MKSSVLHITAAAATDVGRLRDGNEDSLFVGSSVFAVADGMGGHQAGEVASAMALEPIGVLDGRPFADADDASRALVTAMEEANRLVVERSRSNADLRGMGTTLTAVVVHGDRLVAAHVGDSRAYLLRAGEAISQLTTDHTLVERLVREGRLSRDEAGEHPQRNVITRAIGNDPEVVVDALPPLQLQAGDRVLLCSDGLTGPINDADIQTLVEAVGGGQDAVDALVAAANEAGGPDNITVILLEVEGGPDGHRSGAEGASSATVVTQVDAPPRTDDEGQGGAEVRRIRTDERRPDEDWAATMGRLGDRQGADDRGASRGARGRRLLAGLLAVVVLLGVLIGGGYFLLSRAYFVGEHEGVVAIHRGLPERVAGVPLFWVMEDQISEIPVGDLPAFRRADVAEGLSAGTLREAQQVVAVLQQQVEEAGEIAPSAAPTPAVTATPSPGT